MQMKQQPLDSTEFNAKDAAKLIGKSIIWLAKLVADGFVKPGRKQGRESLYRPADVAHGYIRYLTDEQRRSSKTATLSEVQSARAAEIRLRIAREQHELVDLDEAICVVDEVVGALKSDLDGLAASVTRDPVLRGVIEVKVDEIFQRHAAGLKQKAGALRASGTAPDADTEDDAGPVGNQESPLSG
jgi:phage terminase Nu1 subunit (DNA packaging protein)